MPEAETEENEFIKTQIMTMTSVSHIPFCAQIAFVEIEESPKTMEDQLEKEGFSKNVAKNVSYFYRV